MPVDLFWFSWRRLFFLRELVSGFFSAPPRPRCRPPAHADRRRSVRSVRKICRMKTLWIYSVNKGSSTTCGLAWGSSSVGESLKARLLLAGGLSETAAPAEERQRGASGGRGRGGASRHSPLNDVGSAAQALCVDDYSSLVLLDTRPLYLASAHQSQSTQRTDASVRATARTSAQIASRGPSLCRRPKLIREILVLSHDRFYSPNARFSTATHSCALFSPADTSIRRGFEAEE